MCLFIYQYPYAYLLSIYLYSLSFLSLNIYMHIIYIHIIHIHIYIYAYWYQCMAQSKSESLCTPDAAGVSSIFMLGSPWSSNVWGQENVHEDSVSGLFSSLCLSGFAEGKSFTALCHPTGIWLSCYSPENHGPHQPWTKISETVSSFGVPVTVMGSQQTYTTGCSPLRATC